MHFELAPYSIGVAAATMEYFLLMAAVVAADAYYLLVMAMVVTRIEYVAFEPFVVSTVFSKNNNKFHLFLLKINLDVWHIK